jgi:predicted phosphodiesterase
MAEENPYRAILFGHTHVPYAREVAHGGAGASTLFVNVGSAGRPKDGDWRVCYAIVDPVATAVDEAAVVEFVRVPYDYERLQKGLAHSDLITTFEPPPHWSAR